MRDVAFRLLGKDGFESHRTRTSLMHFGSACVPLQHAVIIEVFVVNELGLLTLRLLEVDEVVEFTFLVEVA